MKNVLKCVKEKAGMITATVGAMAMACPNVFAEGGAEDTMISMLGQIVPYIGAIGIPIACVGAFKLVMAFRNDQGDAVPAAARDLAIGVVLILFSAIWDGVSGVML